MISVHFQGRPFNIKVIQVYAPTSNAEEAEVEQFYEDLPDLPEHQKRCPFHHRGVENVKVGSQDIPRVTGKFCLGVQNEAGQRLTEFCQENMLVIASTLVFYFRSGRGSISTLLLLSRFSHVQFCATP